MPKNDKFFDNQSHVSFIKSDIVVNYFYKWAKIIISKMSPPKIAFIDLFAGPGKYKDESDSTPILITKKIIQHKDLRERTVLLFNDDNSSNIKLLEKEISNLPDIDTLKHKIIYRNKKVTKDILNKLIAWIHPALLFLDPWGYKGLSLKSILEIIQPSGTECIFFFNYNRINAALVNNALKKPMIDLFGNEFYIKLRDSVKNQEPNIRQEIITNEVWDFFKKSYTHIVGFLFPDSKGTKTSHILIHVTKHPLGFAKMKEVMKKYKQMGGLDKALYKYSPENIGQESMFGNLDVFQLKHELLNQYRNKKISFQDLYFEHNISKGYTEDDYKTAIKELEEEGKVTCERPFRHTKKNTINNKVLVYFK